MKSKKTIARLAGLFFLISIICGVFAEFFVRQKIFWKEDIASIKNNIIDFDWLLRLGFVSDLTMSLAFFLYAYFLYLIFKHINKNLSLALLLSVAIAVAILCVNMLNQFAVISILSEPGFSETFNPNQVQTISRFFQLQHTHGYKVAQIFYGLYLLPLGYMIYKSNLIPKIIGVFLILGFFGDMIDLVRFFLIPNYESIFLQNISLPADIGEFSLCLWLLIIGVKNPS